MSGKLASREHMEDSLMGKIRETCGDGSGLLPAKRITTDFSKSSPVDMVAANDARILICSNQDQDGSFRTSRIFPKRKSSTIILS